MDRVIYIKETRGDRCVCTVYSSNAGVQAAGADPVPAAEDAGARAQVPPPPSWGRPRDGQHLLLVDKPNLTD